MPVYAKLTAGLNLYGFTSGATMNPGEASDAINVLPRSDGSLLKHWGARRIHSTAFSTPLSGQIGFTYKGKNNDAVTNPARGGNFALADDGAIFTRRDAFYPGALVLTDTEARHWDHSTLAFSSALSLPSGVTVSLNPRPSFLILQNNVYICGWATENLRYDPTDRALYQWGWGSTPTLGIPTVGAGGDLRASVDYQYRAAWIDLYTGEQSGLGAAITATTTASNQTITFGAGDFPVYADSPARHFLDGANLTNPDVGIVLYRTEGNQAKFHFLSLIVPGLAAATLTDNGLFTDTARKASIVAYQDPPIYAGMVEFRNMVYGISWAEPAGAAASDATGTNSARVFFNDFTTTKSHFERSRPLNFRELPLTDGEVLTATAKTGRSIILFSNKDAYEMQVFANRQTGTVQQTLNPLEWTVGCVGPLAWEFVDGWLYWLSDRGPYRWRPGTGEPQWISKNMLPLFIDPMSGFCKMNPESMVISEVFYDRDADVIRYVFPSGRSQVNDVHIYQWAKTELLNGDPSMGWFFGQPNIHSWNHNSSYGSLNPSTSVPESQFDRKALTVFGDNDGFVYEYDPDLTAFGIPDGSLSKFVATAGSATTATVSGGLLVTNDGLDGLRAEIVHANGDVEITTIASTTATVITFDDILVAAVVSGDTIYVGGFAAYWRSWLDHGGDPTASKKSVHFWVGMNRSVGGEAELDVVMTAGDDIPTTARRVRQVKLSANQQKVISSLVGRWFLWEFANSHPNEPFLVSFIKTDLTPLEMERV